MPLDATYRESQVSRVLLHYGPASILSIGTWLATVKMVLDKMGHGSSPASSSSVVMSTAVLVTLPIFLFEFTLLLQIDR